MENWFKKSRLSKGVTLMPTVGNIVDSVEGRWKFPVYFDDCSTFKSPTCHVDHIFLHQNKENIKPVQPKKFVAKVHFSAVFNRNPKFQ